MIALWAEDAEPPHTTLGFIVVTLPTCYESHIHSLRVAKAARGKGLADLLVQACCRLAVHHQGARSIGRWGVVSSNTIMIDWSTRRNLGGPAVLRQYRCKVEDSHSSVQMRDLLPVGWNFRFAQEADADLLLEHFWGEAG